MIARHSLIYNRHLTSTVPFKFSWETPSSAALLNLVNTPIQHLRLNFLKASSVYIMNKIHQHLI